MWVTVQGIDALSTCIDVDDGNETDVSGEDAADEADSSCFPAQVWGPKLAVTSLALLIVLRECRELYAVALELYALYAVADDHKGSRCRKWPKQFKDLTTWQNFTSCTTWQL
jgi:hypothetical protein